MAILTLGVATVGLSQDSNTLATVDVIDGKEVYLLSEPLRSYEVVSTVRTGPKVSSLFTRGLISEDINDKAAQFTRKSIRKMKKKGIEFDAVRYSSGKRIQAIRFKEEATEDTKRLAKVQDNSGVYAFIMAEPVNSYKVDGNVKFVVRAVPLLTYGIINNSIERDVATLAKKANKKLENPQYITYTTGDRATIISFE